MFGKFIGSRFLGTAPNRMSAKENGGDEQG